MKFFIDTANIKEIKEAVELGVLDGVTTNPTLVARENRDFKELILEICDIVDGPISVEAVGLNADEILKEAIEYSNWHKNIVIKVPIIKEGLKAVKKCNEIGIKTNVTLIFSSNQALLAAKAGADYVSPFIGRLDDIGHEGMVIVNEILTIINNYDFKTEVIVASIRHPQHVLEAAMIGAHIATIPFSVITKLIKHQLTDEGLQRFLDDWAKLKK
ncbi:MAG: fructose-6-phosphate aldolase [Candidatus Lokiarchaeota archaeon]|nr:fructose-6-phosphate aldolase [Candidatus Lokiarchaeota archaeon]